MIKKLCKKEKNLIRKRLGKVLAGVLSCCMLLNGCGNAERMEVTWQFEEEAARETEEAGSLGQDTMAEETAEECLPERIIYVYICGAVTNPGVYEIAEGSRLFEVIDIAGGMLEEADVTSQNLARVVSDGEQIRILTKEETEELKKSGMSVSSNGALTGNGLVNINTATMQELTTLTGIGESRALAIIAYREEHGFFQSIDGIKKVTGIKDGLFEKIKNQITI